jgi:late competence protein required for DNA uptake (superfamily II DNA/RNA helicase)
MHRSLIEVQIEVKFPQCLYACVWSHNTQYSQVISKMENKTSESKLNSKTLKEQRIRCPRCKTLTPLSRIREVPLPCDCGRCKEIYCQDCFEMLVHEGKIHINKKALLSS